MISQGRIEFRGLTELGGYLVKFIPIRTIRSVSHKITSMEYSYRLCPNDIIHNSRMNSISGSTVTVDDNDI